MGVFQAASIITTTGFGTADYLIWPPLAVGIIFLCFFIGGMGGSTGGGVKVIRHVLLFKNSFKEVNQLVHPQAVIPIRLGARIVPQDVMRNVLSFMVLYLGLVGLGTFFMALFGLDMPTAFGAAISSVGNVGPSSVGVLSSSGTGTNSGIVLGATSSDVSEEGVSAGVVSLVTSSPEPQPVAAVSRPARTKQPSHRDMEKPDAEKRVPDRCAFAERDCFEIKA